MYKVQSSMTNKRVSMEHNKCLDCKAELINNDEQYINYNISHCCKRVVIQCMSPRDLLSFSSQFFGFFFHVVKFCFVLIISIYVTALCIFLHLHYLSLL